MIKKMSHDSQIKEFQKTQRQVKANPESWWRDLNRLMLTYIDPAFFAIRDQRGFRDQLFRVMNELYIVFRFNYGSEIAQQFMELVYRFVVNGMNVVNSMYNTEQFVVEVNLNEWYQTADEIAAYLARLNDAWSSKMWIEYIYLYINYILELTRAALERNFEQSESIYRNIESVTEQMGNYMMAGLPEVPQTRR